MELSPGTDRSEKSGAVGIPPAIETTKILRYTKYTIGSMSARVDPSDPNGWEATERSRFPAIPLTRAFSGYPFRLDRLERISGGESIVNTSNS